jgi:pseudaminic acid biosynthesis-associated methylase
MNNEITQTALEQWRGEFGAEYMMRNQANADAILQATEVFRRIIGEGRIVGDVKSILEVGANVGINLRGLRAAMGNEIKLAAIEPNKLAATELRAATELNLSEVIESTCYEIPVSDNSFDLVFTSGVLIHVPPEGLETAMGEIVRVAAKFVLCVEYFSHTPVELPYRSQGGLLWKRDFGQKYLEVCPDLKPLAYGFIWQAEFSHFDNLNWWLFRKLIQS